MNSRSESQRERHTAPISGPAAYDLEAQAPLGQVVAQRQPGLAAPDDQHIQPWDLLRGGRTGVHRSRLAVEHAGLNRARRSRLLWRQLQQAEEPGVLLPQPGNLVAQCRELVVNSGDRQD